MNRPKPRDRRPFPGQCVKVNTRQRRCTRKAEAHGLCKLHLEQARRLHEVFRQEAAAARETGAAWLPAKWFHTGTPALVRLKP